MELACLRVGQFILFTFGYDENEIHRLKKVIKKSNKPRSKFWIKEIQRIEEQSKLCKKKTLKYGILHYNWPGHHKKKNITGNNIFHELLL